MEGEVSERTHLLPGSQARQSPYGSDFIEYGGFHNTAFIEDGPIPATEEDSVFGDDLQRQDNHDVERVHSADSLLYMMRFAFINKSFDALKEVQRAEETRHGADKIIFKEKILDGLRESSLTVREKLRIHRLLTSSSGRRRNQETHTNLIKTKTRRDLGFSLAIWESTITSLAAYFGSNVASYFTFLRILFLLNLATGIIYAAFTTVPQIISGHYDLDFPTNVIVGVNDTGHFGYLSRSLMFYGTYQEFSNDNLKDYDIPVAYFLTWAGISIVTFIFIVLSMHIRYRKSKHTEHDADYPFTWSMFCLWDHSIYRRSGVKNRLKSFCTELKEKIREERSFKIQSIGQRLKIYCGRLFSNIIVLGLLGGSGYLIFYVEDKFVLPEEAGDFLGDIFDKYQLAVVVSVLKLVVPFLFEMLARLEGWHPRTEQKINTARTTFFYYASLVVFILSLTDLSQCSGSDDTCEDHSDKNASMSITTTVENKAKYCCWENKVGEEIFKVILVDLGLCIVVGLVVHVLRAFVVKYNICCKKLGYSEFAVTSNLLDLVYGQGLVWLGLYFSPLLALAASVKLFIVFYFRYFVAKVANVPPKKMFRASRSGTFYLFLLLTTWFLCTVPVGYYLTELTPSWHCGPFKCEPRVYDVLHIDLSGDFDWLIDVLFYIRTAIVIVPVIVVLLLLVFYYYTRASSYSKLAKELRKQLIFERRVERKKVFAKALSAPAGSIGRVSGTSLSTLIEED